MGPTRAQEAQHLDVGLLGGEAWLVLGKDQGRQWELDLGVMESVDCRWVTLLAAISSTFMTWMEWAGGHAGKGLSP